MMQTNLMKFGAALLVAALPAAVGAQSKTLPGKVEVVTASVEAIERASRQVTVKKADGTYESFYVPEEVKRFDTLKIGDKVTARYYENVVFRVQAPGEKPVNTDNTALTRNPDKPGATVARQRVMTVTITKIDPKVPSITVAGPNGWTYSRRVQDTKLLAQVKVGDKVDIAWTEASAIAIE